MLTITQAAIRSQDGQVFTVPRPGRHHTVILQMVEQGHSLKGATQGFLTSAGAFVTRYEAARIAVGAGQVLQGATPQSLLTEHLW